MNGPPRPGPPLWLLAELTYRCPLHCVFCYNPVDVACDGITTWQADVVTIGADGRPVKQRPIECSGEGY